MGGGGGISVYVPGWGGLCPRGFSVQRGCLCPGRGLSVPGWSLSRGGVSVQCESCLCPGGSRSWEGGLCPGGSLSGGYRTRRFSVMETPPVRQWAGGKHPTGMHSCFAKWERNPFYSLVLAVSSRCHMARGMSELIFAINITAENDERLNEFRVVDLKYSQTTSVTKPVIRLQTINIRCCLIRLHPCFQYLYTRNKRKSKSAY